MALTLIPIIRINTNSGIINRGNVLFIAPASVSKSISGSGGGNTGDLSSTFTGVNITITNGSAGVTT
ncbi:spore germination protein [Paenibacillus thermotolerans]|uniref:spore germination protein n=1 Tax=Paenibacillus thermotolerans TaxID=3027807 RepID=UPI002368A096|nr:MULTISPECIES: spore germination protein [unclassified Paenibacillus]